MRSLSLSLSLCARASAPASKHGGELCRPCTSYHPPPAPTTNPKTFQPNTLMLNPAKTGCCHAATRFKPDFFSTLALPRLAPLPAGPFTSVALLESCFTSGWAIRPEASGCWLPQKSFGIVTESTAKQRPLHLGAALQTVTRLDLKFGD